MNTGYLYANPPVEAEARTKRILIVDDEAGYLLALRKILQGPAVTVDTAETVEAAKALIEEQAYNAVIADVMLTTLFGEEGLEILRHVKNRKPGTKVIIVTAHGNSGILEKALVNGADLFFEKPLSSHILIQVLKSWGIEC
jgi:DNA-binding NtrC family response regulator